MELEFRHFDREKDIDKQRELFKRSFPETIGTPVPEMLHYQWKFVEYPLGETFEYLAVENDVLAGYYAAIPYRYRVKGVYTSVGMVCDVMTSPDFRGKGVFTKIGRYATSELSEVGIPFTTGYPIRKAVIPGHLKVGWNIAFELPLYIKFLKADSLLKSKGMGVLKFMVNPILSFYNCLVREKTSTRFTSSVFSEFNDIIGYDVFLEEWMDEHPIALYKNRSFCNWRYSAPERCYSFIAVYDATKLVGLVSFREIEREGVPAIGVLDYMFLEEWRQEKITGYIGKILSQEAQKREKEAVMIIASNYSANKHRLLLNAFIKSPFKFSFIIKNLTQQFESSYLHDEKNWDVMWVDSDDL